MQPPGLTLSVDELWQMACDPFHRVRQPEIERPADADAFRGFLVDARDSSTYQLEIMATRWALHVMGLPRTSGEIVRKAADAVLRDYANAVVVHTAPVRLPNGAPVGFCFGCIAIEHEFCLFCVQRDIFPPARRAAVQILALLQPASPVNALRCFYAWAPTSGGHSILARLTRGTEK